MESKQYNSNILQKNLTKEFRKAVLKESRKLSANLKFIAWVQNTSSAEKWTTYQNIKLLWYYMKVDDRGVAVKRIYLYW